MTNDAVAPLRSPRLKASETSAARRGRRFSARRNATGQAVAGRWSLTEELFRAPRRAGPRMRAQAELMLERYGIVTRETVLAEGVPGGFSSLYGELSNLEILGTARRGYFVEGLGGAQFALAGAVERLRSLPRVDEEHVVLAVTDPAQPYGASLKWPRPPSREGDADGDGRGGRRPSRVAGAFVLLRNGEPVVYVERGGKGLLLPRPPRGRPARGGAGRDRRGGPASAACPGSASSGSTASRSSATSSRRRWSRPASSASLAGWSPRPEPARESAG